MHHCNCTPDSRKPGSLRPTDLLNSVPLLSQDFKGRKGGWETKRHNGGGKQAQTQKVIYSWFKPRRPLSKNPRFPYKNAVYLGRTGTGPGTGQTYQVVDPGTVCFIRPLEMELCIPGLVKRTPTADSNALRLLIGQTPQPSPATTVHAHIL